MNLGSNHWWLIWKKRPWMFPVAVIKPYFLHGNVSFSVRNGALQSCGFAAESTQIAVDGGAPKHDQAHRPTPKRPANLHIKTTWLQEFDGFCTKSLSKIKWGICLDFDGCLSPLARCHWLKPFALLHGPVLQARYGLIDCGSKANKVNKEM